jgi:hypothetical protein
MSKQPNNVVMLSFAPDMNDTRQDGEPMQPRSLTQMWSTITTTLPRIRFHDLRHAHATYMLAAGVHPKVANERLGHPGWALRSIFTATFCPACKKMPPRALTKLFKSPKRSAPKTLGSKAVANARFGLDQSKDYKMFSMAWRGGRVVECTALEMRHRCKPIGGSNPSLSARLIWGAKNPIK